CAAHWDPVLLGASPFECCPTGLERKRGPRELQTLPVTSLSCLHILLLFSPGNLCSRCRCDALRCARIIRFPERNLPDSSVFNCEEKSRQITSRSEAYPVQRDSQFAKTALPVLSLGTVPSSVCPKRFLSGSVPRRDRQNGNKAGTEYSGYFSQYCSEGQVSDHDLSDERSKTERTHSILRQILSRTRNQQPGAAHL